MPFHLQFNIQSKIFYNVEDDVLQHEKMESLFSHKKCMYLVHIITPISALSISHNSAHFLVHHLQMYPSSIFGPMSELKQKSLKLELPTQLILVSF